MYKVIKAFSDLNDNNYPYSVGATYPRNGVKVSEKRLAELSSKKNRRKMPLIEKVEEKETDDAPKKATKKRSK